MYDRNRVFNEFNLKFTNDEKMNATPDTNNFALSAQRNSRMMQNVMKCI